MELTDLLKNAENQTSLGLNIVNDILDGKLYILNLKKKTGNKNTNVRIDLFN